MFPRKTIAVAALTSAAWFGTAPANADDAQFMDALDMLGITIDPVSAVAMGRSVCSSFDDGLSLPAVVGQLSAAHGLSIEDASLVAGFSVAEYCDHHKEALAG